MNTTDNYDLDLDQYLNKNSVEYNNVRIGFSQRSLIFTNHAHIAIYQDIKSMDYKFCCYNGMSDFNSYTDTYFPIAIIISPNTDIAEGIISLRCIPVYENKTELKNEGVEIVFSYKGELEPSLYRDGKKQIISSNENYLLIWYYLYVKYKETSEQARWKQASLTKENIEKKLISIEKNLEAFSIEDVLKGLKVNVREIFISKAGGDDRYYVHKQVQTDFPIERMDSYIQNYIGIGDREIYKDSGYTSAYNLALKDLITGEYNEEQLNKEKERLISNYSKKKHAEALLMDYIVDNAHPAYYTIDNIEKKIKMLERASNFWIYWRIIKSKQFSSYFDIFDRSHNRSSIKEGDLNDANKHLFESTQNVIDLERMKLFTGVPYMDIF